MLIDIAAERAVLSGLCKFGSNFKIEVEDILNNDCFSKDFNKIILQCAADVLNSSQIVDIPSILSSANKLGFCKIFEQSSNISFLKALWDYPIVLENAIVLCKKLKRLSIARQSQAKLKEAWEKLGELTGDESIDEIFSTIENPITDFTTELHTGLSNQPKLLFDEAESYINYLADNPVNQIGFSTPWKNFDLMIGGGLRKKSITCFATRTSVGKSHILKEIGIGLAKQNIKVLFLDTEMSKESTLHRAIAGLTNITINDIECGRFSKNQEEKDKIIEVARKYNKLPIYYQSIAGRNFDEVMSLCKRWIHKEVGKNGIEFNDCVIILDYIKLMDISALTNIAEYQLFGEYLHNLHDFSVRYNLPVITAVQTNRSGINDKEDLSTVSISDRISWLVSNMVLMRELSIEEQHEFDYKGNVKVMSMKSRFGNNLGSDDWLIFKREGQYSKFTEIGKCSELRDTSGGLDE